MTAVTQTISSYTFGISEQPDSRKKPGQLTFLDNALPDITSGLVKRPGTRYVAELTETPGTWFNYYVMVMSSTWVILHSLLEL